MIRNFRSKMLARLWNDGTATGTPPKVELRIEAVLTALDAATGIDDLKTLAGFHALKGNRKGEPIRYAVTITKNWRITFAPVESEDELQEEFYVEDVDYEDYH